MSARPYDKVLPLLFPIAAVAVWAVCSQMRLFPPGSVPSPMEVAQGFREELVRDRLGDDLVASLFRVFTGFLIAVLAGLPLGLAMGLRLRMRDALLPTVNFFRNLSPLAWIPFAILWFGIGDVPAIFLIFMTTFFPVIVATAAAVAGIPKVYFRLANDHGLKGGELLWQVTLPAIMPQVITTLRVTAGLSWVVVVAAEMIAGRDGLGFLIWDARNALRPDLLVVGMIVIGLIGVAMDRVVMQLTRIPSVRWGYEK